jgi:hypothetical protein
MLDPDLAALVRELESLGLKFTVTPRLDGSLRLNCWRYPNAWKNRDRIKHLVADRIESYPEDAAHIAQFINEWSLAATSTPKSEDRCAPTSNPDGDETSHRSAA